MSAFHLKSMLLGALCLMNTAASAIPVEASTLEARQNTYPRIAWSFSISGSAIINDDENWPSDDERWSGTITPSTFVLNPGANRLYTWSQAMGGEIRAELDLRPTTYAANLQQYPNLAYAIRLYEGDNENTNDLDGQTSGDITFAREGATNQASVNFQRRVTNTNENTPDDFVDLTITVTATPVIVWA